MVKADRLFFFFSMLKLVLESDDARSLSRRLPPVSGRWECDRGALLYSISVVSKDT